LTLASNNLRFNVLASKLMRHHRAQRATVWHKVAPEDRPRACFFGDGKNKDPNLPSDATRRQTELAMKDLMHILHQIVSRPEEGCYDEWSCGNNITTVPY